MSIQAVLFDLDGTLLDTALDFETAINLVLAEEGKPPLPANGIRAYVTNGSVGVVTAAFGITQTDSQFPRLQSQLLAHYRQNLTGRTCLFPGLESTLSLLTEKQIPWGIVTNKPREYAVPVVSALLPESAVLVCPDDVSTPKPDPAGLLLACEHLGVAPTQCIYVGDHHRDIEAGTAAQMNTVSVGWGYVRDKKEHHDWGADGAADTPADLASILAAYLDGSPL